MNKKPRTIGKNTYYTYDEKGNKVKATAIKTVTTEQVMANAATFDLKGHKTGQMKKGRIYVKGNKK